MIGNKLETGVFATSYVPSIEYISLISELDNFIIDEQDVWKRQSLRNRTFILSPNGIQMLTVPVCHPTEKKNYTKDIKISYDLPWVRTHKGALEAAYNTSAFFDFFKDDLWKIYDSKYHFLVDFNIEILNVILKRFKIAKKLTVKETVENENLKNFNSICDSSNHQPTLLTEENFKPYPQVFSYKFEFIKNLSSLDLLANKGQL
jgi:hypothetical protein